MLSKWREQNLCASVRALVSATPESPLKTSASLFAFVVFVAVVLLVLPRSTLVHSARLLTISSCIDCFTVLAMSAEPNLDDSHIVQDLTRSSPPPPLPPPTTISTRSLRPRRLRGRSTAGSSQASTASGSRSRSRSVAANPPPGPHQHNTSRAIVPTAVRTSTSGPQEHNDQDRNLESKRKRISSGSHTAIEQSAKRQRATPQRKSSTPLSARSDPAPPSTPSRDTPDEQAVAALVASKVSQTLQLL